MKTFTLLLVFLVACSATTEDRDPAVGSSSDVSSSWIPVDVAAGHRGLHLRLDAMGGFLGRIVNQDSAGGFNRTVGDGATLAISQLNGAVHLSPNAETEGLARQIPFSGNGDDHNEAVRRFFVERGLPEDQIASVTALAGSTRSAGPSDSFGTLVEQHYTTSIQRVIDGVPVPESVATARLDGRGQVVSLTAFWPEIPTEAVTTAQSLSARLRAGETNHGLRLPVVDPSGGEAAVHHTRSYVHEPVRAIATFDVRELGYLRSFDSGGREVNLHPAEPVTE